MKAGVIAELNSESGIEDVNESELLSSNHRFDSLDRCLEVRGRTKTNAGDTVVHGRAAFEVLDEQETVEISDKGNIETQTRSTKETKYTEFLAVPDEFVVVSSGRGDFLFQILQKYAEHTVQPAYLDLDSFYDQHEDALTWKVGFDERNGRAENGVLHGENVLADSDIGDIISLASKNQLGLDYTYQETNIKVTLARSGYVEVYQPSNFDMADFSSYISSEILPFVVIE